MTLAVKRPLMGVAWGKLVVDGKCFWWMALVFWTSKRRQGFCTRRRNLAPDDKTPLSPYHARLGSCRDCDEIHVIFQVT